MPMIIWQILLGISIFIAVVLLVWVSGVFEDVKQDKKEMEILSEVIGLLDEENAARVLKHFEEKDD